MSVPVTAGQLAESATVSQLILTAAAGVVTVATLAAFRWVRKVARALLATTDTIKAFGDTWQQAAASLDYLHQLRHDVIAQTAGQRAFGEALNRVVGRLDTITRRLDTITSERQDI